MKIKYNLRLNYNIFYIHFNSLILNWENFSQIKKSQNFWQNNNTPDGNPYYTTHIQKLKKEWILLNDNPKIKESRWYVMIMLMRSAK